MAITKADERELEQFQVDHKQFGGRKEDYFALMYLTKKFGKPASEFTTQVSFGNHDYGIDAWHIDRDARTLFLYQFKWSENHLLFRESLERLANGGMQRIFGNGMVDPMQADLLTDLRAELLDVKPLIQRVCVRFVYKGKQEAAEDSDGLQERRENLENKRHLVHQFFNNNDVDFTFEFISGIRTATPPPPPPVFPVHFAGNSFVQLDENGPALHIGLMRLMDLYRIWKALQAQFLDRNIRYGLSSDNPPNRKIREALGDIVIKGKAAPEVFTFNHNGVTLAAEVFERNGDQATLRSPRLLNGAQTVTSLAAFIEKSSDNPLFHKNIAILESLQVVAKVVVDDPHSIFVTNVTISNNRQNPVLPWNLRANDRIQCDLADHFKEIGIFYARQEGAIESQTDEGLEDQGIKDRRPIQIRRLAQTFLAAQGEVAKMAKLAEVFESQKVYDETFKTKYLESDARRIVVAYKVGLCINRPTERLQELSALKHGIAIRKGKNLVWALLIQALFNSEDLADVLDTFGQSLKKETNFVVQLEKLASSRLQHILKPLLNSPENAKKLENETYDFLKANQTFKTCMKIAYDKYGWKLMPA